MFFGQQWNDSIPDAGTEYYIVSCLYLAQDSRAIAVHEGKGSLPTRHVGRIKIHMQVISRSRSEVAQKPELTLLMLPR